MSEELPFWKTKKLPEMNMQEWESVCDGCARCCLFKLEDEDTGELFYTDVACKLLDHKTCRCTDYKNRSTLVPDCITMSPENPEVFSWFPPTCAYRLLSEGKDLYPWHPLISGDPGSVSKAGIAIGGWAVPEDEVDDVEDHIISLQIDDGFEK
ncbi:MAG: YcgN family cysteine cluster protein [Gammaproteobacteria bacterium]